MAPQTNGRGQTHSQKRKPVTIQRSGRLTILHRALALQNIFRTSEGKVPFTIETLANEAESRYPHLFSPRPSADTITRAVKVLREVEATIQEYKGETSPLPVEGSRKQLVWIYEPGAPVLKSVGSISDINERVEAIISLATAAEALAPLAGLRIHDALRGLLESIPTDASMARLARNAKRVGAKYSVGNTVKKNAKAKNTLIEKQRQEKLRTLDECVRNNHRVKIVHRHMFGQKEEKDHIIEPVALRDRNGSTLVVGFDVTPDSGQKRLKQFKLDRIAKVEDLKQLNQFEYDGEGNLTGRLWPTGLAEIPLFPLDTILGNTIHGLIPRPDAKEVSGIVIEVRREAANWVREEMLNPRQKTAPTTFHDGSKGLRVTIERAYIDDITPRIIGLGQHVLVLEPAELVSHIGSILRRAADQYASPTAVGEGGKPAAPERAD